MVTAPRQIRVPNKSHKIGKQDLIGPGNKLEVYKIAGNPQHPIGQQVLLVVFPQETSKLVRPAFQSEQAGHEARYEQGSEDTLVAREARQHRLHSRAGNKPIQAAVPTCNRGEWVVYAYAVKLSAYSYCFVMPAVRLQDRTNLNDLHFVVVVVVVVIIIIVMFCYQK